MGDRGSEGSASSVAATPGWMRPVRAGLVAGGGTLMLYAVFGAVTDRSDRIGGHLIFLIAVLLGHDWLLMPLAVGIGALLTRTVPSRARAETAAAAYISGVLLVIALPLVLGLGKRPDDPSALPLNYGRGLVVCLAVVWLAAGATLLYRRHRRRPARSRTAAPTRR